MLPFRPDAPRYWETAMDAVNDGVCVLGADGLVLTCNQAAAAALEQPHQAIIGQPADRVLARAFGAIRPARVAYLDDHPRPQTVEVERGERTFRITIMPVLDDSHQLSGSVLTVVEITEHRRRLEDERLLREQMSEAAHLRDRAEELQDHASRMASLEKLKSQFLRLATHELRSPVGVLNGYVSLLEDGSLGELPPAARAALPIMAAKIIEMNLLIEQLLDTARLEDSRLALKLAPVDIREVVDSAVASARPLAGDHHHLVVNQAADSVRVRGDSSRLRMIVTNLLENAIKYSPNGGDVECTVGTWDGHATVAVTDHGLGIDSQQMHLLFTRFGRLTTPENEHILGSGLGLYLSRELARMHGGDLTVESTAGSGSAFTLRLPLLDVSSRA